MLEKLTTQGQRKAEYETVTLRQLPRSPTPTLSNNSSPLIEESEVPAVLQEMITET